MGRGKGNIGPVIPLTSAGDVSGQPHVPTALTPIPIHENVLRLYKYV